MTDAFACTGGVHHIGDSVQQLDIA
jgi:hypothetical protein